MGDYSLVYHVFHDTGLSPLIEGNVAKVANRDYYFPEFSGHFINFILYINAHLFCLSCLFSVQFLDVSLKVRSAFHQASEDCPLIAQFYR